MRTRAVVSLAALLAATQVTSAAEWSEVTLSTTITPLENRVAALGHGADDPDLLVFTLWSTGVNMNHLGAFRVPAPYDGSGVTFTPDIDVGPLFGVGDICVIGENRAVVPYVKFNAGNFDVFVAELENGSWTTGRIDATAAGDFHSSDCFISQDGIFVLALNDSAARYDFFQRDLPGGATTQESGPGIFDFLVAIDSFELGGTPVSPFDGGATAFGETRMSMFVIGSFEAEAALGLAVENIDLNRYLLIGTANTLELDGSYLPSNFANGSGEMEADLPLRRSLVGGSEPVWAVVQRDGMLELERIVYGGPGDVTIPLGPITPGSLFGFQGVDVETGADGMVYVVADNSYQVDPDTLIVTEITGYPFLDLGGPANIVFPPGFAQGFAVGPGSQVLGILDLGVIFQDGFETGDTQAWSNVVN